MGESLEVIITQWALDTYLDLKHRGVFDRDFYNDVIRPDVLLLKEFPNSPKFGNWKFWSQATMGSVVVSRGFKMKWHQVGNGQVQLRLTICHQECFFLCQGYVKLNSAQDRREIAKLKTRIQLIFQGQYTICGRLK
jgi:hypothetical protein